MSDGYDEGENGVEDIWGFIMKVGVNLAILVMRAATHFCTPSLNPFQCEHFINKISNLAKT